MMRTCLGTVEKMIAVIPDGSLKDDLKKFHDGVFLELPEDNTRLWRQVADILATHYEEALSATPVRLSKWEREMFRVYFGPHPLPDWAT